MAIDDPDQAQRLARAICNDIRLYHPEAIEADEPARSSALAGPIWEGMELYASRVSPALEAHYGAAVREVLGLELALVHRPAGRGAVSPAAHPPTRRDFEQPTAAGSVAVWIGVGALCVLLVATAAGAAFLALAH